MEAREYEFEAIGTHWHIEFELESGDPDALMRDVHNRIAQFDKNYSRFREDSLVTRMSKVAGRHLMPDDADPMLSLYFDLYERTGGALTPLIGQVLIDAGYDAEYSLVPKEISMPPKLGEVLSYESPYLTLHTPTMLDFGAAGKGYLVDIVAKILLEAGAVSSTVDAGGDISVYSANNVPVRIGLEHPLDTTQAIGVAEIVNQSICGSAGNRRAWDRFHHIIDPRSLKSPRDILAVWVVADTALLADALTTCLYMVPVGTLSPHYSFEYLLLRPDFSVEKSANFPAEIFS